MFSGSVCVGGSGVAVVIRTGDATLIGTMVNLTGSISKNPSLLKKDIGFFVRNLLIFALSQGIIIYIIGIINGIDPLTLFTSGFIVIIVGNIPQGLPTTLVACLVIVSEKMRNKNVFVKKLDTIETLGACSCICTGM